MANLNKVMLMGNITRDIQTKYTPNQTMVADFGIAMNRRYKTQSGEEKEEVTFIDCTAFGRTAEVINQYFTKGKPIFIEGRLKYDQWEDKQGGGKRSKISVVVDHFQFIGGDRDGGGGERQERGSARPQQQRRGPEANDAAGSEPFPDEQQFKDDDIPF